MNKLDAVISLDNHIMRMYTMAWGISDKDFCFTYRKCYRSLQ